MTRLEFQGLRLLGRRQASIRAWRTTVRAIPATETTRSEGALKVDASRSTRIAVLLGEPTEEVLKVLDAFRPEVADGQKALGCIRGHDGNAIALDHAGALECSDDPKGVDVGRVVACVKHLCNASLTHEALHRGALIERHIRTDLNKKFPLSDLNALETEALQHRQDTRPGHVGVGSSPVVYGVTELLELKENAFQLDRSAQDVLHCAHPRGVGFGKPDAVLAGLDDLEPMIAYVGEVGQPDDVAYRRRGAPGDDDHGVVAITQTPEIDPGLSRQLHRPRDVDQLGQCPVQIEENAGLLRVGP